MNAREHTAIELLVACSTPHLTEVGATRIRELAEEVSDWPEVLRLARFYRAGPALDDRLRASGVSNVPADLKADLHKAHLANAARSARLTQRLADIQEALDAAGIASLGYKGPSLAHEAYEQPSLRQFDDLDLLVDRGDLHAAKRTIEKLGYTEAERLPHGSDRSPCGPSTPHVLRSRDGSHDVDLSGRIFHDYFSFRLPRKRLWEASRQVVLDGRTVRTIPVDALFLCLCVHGAKHLWSRPAWIADVAGLLFRQAGETDWREILDTARAADGLRMLRLGVELAAQTFGAPVPPPLRLVFRPDPRAEALVTETRHRIRERAGQPERDDLDRARYHLRLRRHFRSRLRYVLVRALAPSYNDWRSLSLPRPLYPLYYPLRAVRLFMRALRAPRHRPAR